MPKVMSRPAWLLLVTPIFFYLSHLLLRAFDSCCACCSASITEVTAAKKTLSLLPTLAFLFSPQAAPGSVPALAFERQLGEIDGGTAGLRNNTTERKKLVFHLEQLVESPCGAKNASASPEQGEPWGGGGQGPVTGTESETRMNVFSAVVSTYVHVTPQLHTPLPFQPQ